MNVTLFYARHSGASRNPVLFRDSERRWTPAFAGVTPQS